MNALATFQCLMETYLGNCNSDGVSPTWMIRSSLQLPQKNIWKGFAQCFHGYELPDWSWWSVSFSKWFIWDIKFQMKVSKLMVVRSKLSRTGLFPSWLQSSEASWGSQTTIDTSVRVILKLLAPSMIKFLVKMQLIRNKKSMDGWMPDSLWHIEGSVHHLCPNFGLCWLY